MPKVKSARHRINNDEVSARGGPASSSSSTTRDRDSGKVVRNLLTPDTSIGQHFLKNPAVVDAIVNKAYDSLYFPTIDKYITSI
jgi:hypothetical protein